MISFQMTSTDLITVVITEEFPSDVIERIELFLESVVEGDFNKKVVFELGSRIGLEERKALLRFCERTPYDYSMNASYSISA